METSENKLFLTQSTVIIVEQLYLIPSPGQLLTKASNIKVTYTNEKITSLYKWFNITLVLTTFSNIFGWLYVI